MNTVTNDLTDILFESDLKSVPLVHRGKVRDIYGIGDRHLLIVASDRLSAFDVVLPTPIPGKGRVLTAVSNFWFHHTRHIVANHVVDRPLTDADLCFLLFTSYKTFWRG